MEFLYLRGAVCALYILNVLCIIQPCYCSRLYTTNLGSLESTVRLCPLESNFSCVQRRIPIRRDADGARQQHRLAAALAALAALTAAADALATRRTRT